MMTEKSLFPVYYSMPDFFPMTLAFFDFGLNKLEGFPLALAERQALPGSDVPCTQDPNYSFRDCWIDALFRRTKCQLPFNRWRDDVPLCTAMPPHSDATGYTRIFSDMT